MVAEKETKRQFSAEFKFKVVKEALTTDSGISQICKKYGIGTNLYYKWQEIFYQSAQEGLSHKREGISAAEQRTILKQEQEIARLRSTVAELASENIEFKKKNWE